jgi:hypothetical protein
VDGVSPEVPQEIAVLFQHQHVHALASQEQPQHRPCWTAAGDAAGSVPDVVDLPGRSLCPSALPDGFLRIECHSQTSLYPFVFWLASADE